MHLKYTIIALIVGFFVLAACFSVLPISLHAAVNIDGEKYRVETLKNDDFLFFKGDKLVLSNEKTIEVDRNKQKVQTRIEEPHEFLGVKNAFKFAIGTFDPFEDEILYQ